MCCLLSNREARIKLFDFLTRSIVPTFRLIPLVYGITQFGCRQLRIHIVDQVDSFASSVVNIRWRWSATPSPQALPFVVLSPDRCLTNNERWLTPLSAETPDHPTLGHREHMCSLQTIILFSVMDRPCLDYGFIERVQAGPD